MDCVCLQAEPRPFCGSLTFNPQAGVADVPPTDIITGLIRADTASRFDISQGKSNICAAVASPAYLWTLWPASRTCQIHLTSCMHFGFVPRRRRDGDAAHGGAPHAVRQRDRHPGCGRARGSHRWGLVLGALCASIRFLRAFPLPARVPARVLVELVSSPRHCVEHAPL